MNIAKAIDKGKA